MPYPVTIDVGDVSPDAVSHGAANSTYIGLTNPANQSGKIDTIYIKCKSPYGAISCRVGLCYSTGTNKYKTRSYEDVGALVAGLNTFTGLDLDVEVGDCVQVYATGTTVGIGFYFYGNSLYIEAQNGMDGSEYTYSSMGNYLLLVYATGVTAHADIAAVSGEAIAVGGIPAGTFEIAASVTAVAAVAGVATILPSYGGTASDYPDVPDCVATFYAPSIRMAVGVIAPAMQCYGELFDDIACGVSAVPAACMTCTCRGNDVHVVHLLYHSIYEGRYFLHPTYVNSVYVLGKDTLDQMVYGQDSDATHITEYGEVLKVVMSPLVTSAAIATTVAGDILANTRLEADLGTIVVPPNCGMEIGDVICITDTTVNQTSHNYRVIGHDLIYDPMQQVTQYKHLIRLTEV